MESFMACAGFAYCPSVFLAIWSMLSPAGNSGEVNIAIIFLSINFDNYLFYKIFIYLDNL